MKFTFFVFLFICFVLNSHELLAATLREVVNSTEFKNAPREKQDAYLKEIGVSWAIVKEAQSNYRRKSNRNVTKTVNTKYSKESKYTVKIKDSGSSSDGDSSWPCYILSSITMLESGLCRLNFTFDNHGDECSTNVYFSNSTPEASIRGVSGINGSVAEKKFSIDVTPEARELHLELSSSYGRATKRTFFLESYIETAKRARSNWQTAWQKTEQKLKEKKQADKTAPKIIVFEPVSREANKIIRTDSFQLAVRGKVTDESGVSTLLVNGAKVRVINDGSFASMVKLAFGKNTIKIQSEDIHGNVSEESLAVIRDEYLPDEIIADVDVPPRRGIKNSKAAAVIIGIEEYQYVDKATYAYNDAEVVREYVSSVLGFDKSRIKLATNNKATRAEFDRLLGPNGWLAKNVVSGNSDLVIYFSGHGTTDPATGKSSLLPYDVDPNYSHGYSLDDLITALSQLNARTVTIFLDACFTGQTREKKMLVVNSRALVRHQKPSGLPQNFALFSSSSGTETSIAISVKQHGLFTYYLLKGLSGDADTKNKRIITAGELATYLEEKVKLQAAVTGKDQNPQFIGSQNTIIVKW